MSSAHMAWAGVALDALGGRKGVASRAERVGFQPADLLSQMTAVSESVTHGFPCAPRAPGSWFRFRVCTLQAFLHGPDSQGTPGGLRGQLPSLVFMFRD